MSKTPLIESSSPMASGAGDGGRVKLATPEETQAVAAHTINEHRRRGDFISDYADYADVFELPRAVHEWIACLLIAAVMNGRVFIEWGSVTYSFDLRSVPMAGAEPGAQNAKRSTIWRGEGVAHRSV